MIGRLGLVSSLVLFAVGCADDGTYEYDGDLPVWRLPDDAVEIGPDTFFVGYGWDFDGTEIEGRAFVHRFDDGHYRAKPPGTPGGGGGGSGGSTCWTPIASGAIWKPASGINEGWAADPTDGPDLGGADMAQRLSGDITKWESAASNTGVFGSGSIDTTYDANLGAVDNRNGAEWGVITDNGVIAVTYSWGVWGGNPSTRRIVEWDQIYDTDWAWDTEGDPGSMDFSNIATHEIGHAFGLSHPAGCTEETMFASAAYGETKKRDLNAGDILGISTLY